MSEVNFQAYKDIRCCFGSAAGVVLGTKHAAGDTWEVPRTSSFTMPMLSAPLQVGDNHSGHYGQVETQGRHRDDTSTYEAAFTMDASATTILMLTQSMFGDSSSAAALTPATTSGAMKDAVASATHNTILFENGGSDASAVDLIMPSAFPTSMTIKGDLGTNGGVIQCDATYWSAYRPEETTLTPSAYSHLTDAVYNMFTNAATVSIASQPFICTGFEVTISRTLERVLQKATGTAIPFGYTQTSPYEVTGSITAKRDDSILDLIATFKGDSSGIAVAIGGGNLNLSLPDAMCDVSSVDVGSTPLLVTIPFRGFAASVSASIIDITCT